MKFKLFNRRKKTYRKRQVNEDGAEYHYHSFRPKLTKHEYETLQEIKYKTGKSFTFLVVRALRLLFEIEYHNAILILNRNGKVFVKGDMGNYPTVVYGEFARPMIVEFHRNGTAQVREIRSNNA